jgi:hypothetical protein
MHARASLDYLQHQKTPVVLSFRLVFALLKWTGKKNLRLSLLFKDESGGIVGEDEQKT